MKNGNSVSPGASTAEIDWAQIHRSLASTREKIERTWTPSTEEQDAILKERARLLDQVREMPADAGENIEVVAFQLGQETYGIASSFVRMVCPLRDVTPLPCAPPFILGLINVRGKIVSIVNLKTFFDLPEIGLSDHSKAVILSNGAIEFGILADDVTGVRLIFLKDLQPEIHTLTGLRADFLTGVSKENLIVLNAAKILSAPEVIVHETVG